MLNCPFSPLCFPRFFAHQTNKQTNICLKRLCSLFLFFTRAWLANKAMKWVLLIDGFLWGPAKIKKGSSRPLPSLRMMATANVNYNAWRIMLQAN